MANEHFRTRVDEPRDPCASGDRGVRFDLDRVEGAQWSRAECRIETRGRVEQLLRDHGYSRRNSGPSVEPLIELVFAEINSAWAIAIIEGVERVASENGMSVILTVSGDRHSPGPDWIDGVMRRRPVGVILILSDLSTSHKHQLRTRNTPFVVVDPAGDPAPDVPSIGSANWSGGYQATRHLIELGHRDIAMITGPEDMLCSTARHSGYRAALDASGIKVPDTYVVAGQFHHEDGRERGRAAARALASPDCHLRGKRSPGARCLRGRARVGDLHPGGALASSGTTTSTSRSGRARR